MGDEAVIFCGDFNINARDHNERYILNGRIPHKASSSMCLNVETGYDTNSAKFAWIRNDMHRLVLADAYGDINHMERDADGNILGTSHNVDRLETIDYVYFDE